ncbi:Svx/AvrXca family virulence/avirulence protein [Sphingomonas sp. LM7]|uniref:Svx/AvrXca family virulence/avirulence protein n=1 Tax=Sphingomonas sp. LM7 TaxID=1938607 RepID=UPI0009839079|nr:Svx/AvrXca family virulence/avirulence protein [Sphingomonas sp. LM7]AQR72287.1 avirulence protein [Sphingomonas sp. LM7]
MRTALLLALAGTAIASPAWAGENARCVAGAWKPVATSPADPNSKLPLRYETQHFAFHWQGDLVSSDVAKSAGEHLEYVWSYFLGTLDFPEPDCANATKRKANVFIDASYGLTGGVDDAGNIGMWIGPGGLKDRFGLAHELTHSLQGGTGSFRDTPYGGWLWESHANWMTTQLPEFRSNVHCSVLSVNYPHLYYGSSRVRYCNWQFLEYLKDRFGYQAVNDIWRKAPKRGEAGADQADPMEVLMRNRGWTLAQLNDAFGDWAMHNAHWDYTNPDGSDQGAVYRREYGGYEPQANDRLLRTTVLDPLDLKQRHFAVPAAWAPQRWGYNIVRLHPDAGTASVTATFRGVIQSASATAKLPGLADEPDAIPAPASDWRWGLVAVDAAGKSRYSPLQRGADGAATLAVRPDDQGLYMIVVGTPTQFHHIRWEQPWHSIYRYPWMVQFAGAMPAITPPIAGGRRHANGGGWVAADAKVDASAYVGPYARVLSGAVRGTARVEDHAVVYGGQLLDRARASAMSVIRGNTIVKDDARVATTFLGIGEYEQNIVLSGTAQHIGDVEQRGGSFARGVYSGFVDQAAANDPKRGANLTAPPAEVTAKPTYTWRK